MFVCASFVVCLFLASCVTRDTWRRACWIMGLATKTIISGKSHSVQARAPRYGLCSGSLMAGTDLIDRVTNCTTTNVTTPKCRKNQMQKHKILMTTIHKNKMYKTKCTKPNNEKNNAQLYRTKRTKQNAHNQSAQTRTIHHSDKNL